MARTRRAAFLACAALLVGGALAQEQGAREADASDAEAPRRAPVGAAVAALVNDHPISTFDVQQRVRLMVASSGAQLDERALAQLQQQALRDLVEERLKLQEAERFELVVAEEEIDEEIARIAAGGGGSPEQLAADLASQGIAIETLREQVRARVGWDRLVSGRYGNRVNITDGEVEDQLATLRDASQEQQYLLAEICLPAGTPEQAQEMQAVGMQMIEQMQQGVPFRAIAQQYSACPSAARGGDLGWLRMAEVDPALQEVIPQLEAGNVSLPVQADGMMKMVAMRQVRDAAEAGEPSYEVVYAGAPKSVGREAAAAAFARLPRTNGCRSNALSTDLGEGIGVTVLPMLPASAFAPAFRPALAALDRGEVTDVMEGETAYHAAMLCQKDEGLGLPSRNQVRAQLRERELDRLGRRYLRDVERDGAVDVRVGQEQDRAPGQGQG